jgi:hypothetical protein
VYAWKQLRVDFAKSLNSFQQAYSIRKIKIKAEARKVSYYTGEERVVCSTVITFVRVDEDGHSVPIADHVRKKFLTNQPLPESKI